MAVFEVNSKGTWSRLADPNFDDFREQNRSFQAMAKYKDGKVVPYPARRSPRGQPSRLFLQTF